MPRNGIFLCRKASTGPVVAGTQTNRDMTRIVRGGPGKTYTLPRTATVVGKYAFDSSSVQSVRFHEGLQRLERLCFAYSGLLQLTLPAGVCEVEDGAFFDCRRLRRADLSAARNIK